mmetsp:Transcript_37058/g.121192  ORF Transcript_37058/g.121192 Transcript_37058/m.121192 type:complete len:292 (-) Transcript_37058:181-1056(-)
MGVPERRMRLRVGSEASACAVLVSLFLRRCASSQMRRPHCCPFLKSFWWMRKVSYEMISTAEGLVVNRRTILSTSSFLASATAITWIPFARRRASLIHFVLSSDSQLVTSETGQATIVWVTAGRPSMPCVIRVHRMAIDCSVLPRPMSSARMQPMPSKSRRPMQQSKRNCTPSRWCSRSQRQRKPSTLTAVAGVSGAAGAAGASGAGTAASEPSAPSAGAGGDAAAAAADSPISGSGGLQSTSSSKVYSSSAGIAGPTSGSAIGAVNAPGVHELGRLATPRDLRRRSGFQL